MTNYRMYLSVFNERIGFGGLYEGLISTRSSRFADKGRLGAWWYTDDVVFHDSI